MMTETQFFERLAEKIRGGLEFKIVVSMLGYRQIRTADTAEKDPIEVVTGWPAYTVNVTDPGGPNEQRHIVLASTVENIKGLIQVSDGFSRDYDPNLRLKLLDACGLTGP